MKICLAALLLASAIFPARAALEIIAPDEPQIIFSGTPAAAFLKIRNPAAERAESEYSLRLVQLSSSTAMPVGEIQPWKKIEVLGGQTVLETAPVTLPEVRAMTAFRLEISSLGHVVARIPLLGYPPDTLSRMKDYTGEMGIGLQDPDGKLKPALAKAGITISDLELSDLGAGFQGRLAIVGPYAARKATDSEWKDLATKLAGRGVGVVVLLPLSITVPLPEMLRDGQVVIVRGVKWGDLETSAAAQLLLLQAVELALPKPSP